MMEKVDLYVKKILALLLSFSVFGVVAFEIVEFSPFLFVLSLAISLLLFAYLDFRITGNKPRFLFGMNQSDAFLNKKGGFWNLFKWIVTTLGFAYDMLVWTTWGVFLIFMLLVDFLMLIKFIVFWLVKAVIWFIRQLFPPFIFIFKMIYHYLIKWVWWIYQLTFRNIRISARRNFYFIALWGTIPALFIVFLFYAISQWTGIMELVFISAIFAIIPLVWSYGEISAVRYENREADDYTSVAARFRNGFDAVRSVLFYVILAVGLVVLEIILNMAGWIPNLSMTLLGITLNLNMAISLLLIFLVVILFFSDMIIPSHILYKPEHENNLNSSVTLLGTIGRRFLRYLFSHIPASIFGSFLVVIPFLVVFLAFQLTDSMKDSILETRIETLNARSANEDRPLEAKKYQLRSARMTIYKDFPILAADYFMEYNSPGNGMTAWDERIQGQQRAMDREYSSYREQMDELESKITMAETSQPEPTTPAEIERLSNQRLALEEKHITDRESLKQEMELLQMEMKEYRRIRIQMPILYLFMGILFAVFGGLVAAVLVAYFGNIYFELYDFREDGSPTYWRQTITELSEKDPNQPLLGFTFLAIISVLILIFGTGLF